MRIKKIKVDHMDYDVEYVNDPRGTDNAELYGDINYSLGRIRIRKDLNTMRARETLWHEIVHACFESRIGADHDEHMVDQLTKATLNVLRDNPKLARYLCETD